jgi:hypothetical protein
MCSRRSEEKKYRKDRGRSFVGGSGRGDSWTMQKIER